MAEMLKAFAKKVWKAAIYFSDGRGKEKLESLELYGTVSFDIFDTLIHRDTNAPQDIFERVGKRYERECAAAIRNFKKKRMDAERKAKKEKKQGEITLDDIYFHLEKAFTQAGCRNIDLEKLKSMEVEEEVRACNPDLEMKRIFEGLVEKGKNVVLTSDMYLDGKSVVRILDKCGYHGYQRLYLSSERNCTKRSGGLFRLLLKDLGTEHGEIIHVGDNPKGDYMVPRMLGIKALLI